MLAARSKRSRAAAAAGLFTMLACGAEEAARVELPVQPDASAVDAIETDLGYRVELSEARVVLSDLEFAVGGEAHASPWLRGLGDWLVPVARAHPGHADGGDVTGELRGRFVISWLPRIEAPLGTATLLEGDYQSANFTLARAAADHGLEAGDPLLGHTALFAGRATRDGVRHDFLALIDADGALTGIPCAVPVRRGMKRALGLELLPEDPFEADTLFDGIDFEQLAAPGERAHIARDGTAAAFAAHELLREALSAPDHFGLKALP